MDHAQWTRVKDFVFAALELDESSRQAFVIEACKDDETVRNEVLSLLEQDLKTTYVEDAGDDFDRDFPRKPELRIGNYEILGVLGRGGMGTVYKARDVRLARSVALKVLLPHLVKGEKPRARFVQEARAASSLEHPNICTVYEIGETDEGVLFIATSLVDGMSLREMLRERRPSTEEAIDIATQVASGLAAAHSAGVIHRDVKPSNIMISRTGSVRLVDFGIAKIESDTDLTKTGSTLGTVAYMSPERVKGLPVDNRADIWSLGVILYEMLAGKRPFESDYRDVVGHEIINNDPVDLAELRPELPPALVDVVTRCLSKEPEDRYSSAAELSDDLRNMQSFPSPLEEVAGQVRTTPRVQRTRRPGLLVAGVLVIVAILLGLTTDIKSWFFHALAPEGPSAPEMMYSGPIKIVVAPFATLDDPSGKETDFMQKLLQRELDAYPKEEYKSITIEWIDGEPVETEEQAAALIDSNHAFFVIWGTIASYKGQTEIRSRVTTPSFLFATDDSLMAIPAANFVPFWSGADMTFAGDDLLETRVRAAKETAKLVMSVAAMFNPPPFTTPSAQSVASAFDSTNAALAELEAIRMFRTGDPKHAVPGLERLAASFPDQPSLWSACASARFLIGDTLGALSAAKRSVQVDPTHVYGYLQQAHIFHLRNDHVAATASLETAYRVSHGRSKQTVGRSLALRYTARNMYHKAELLIAELIDSGEEAHDLLARLYVVQGRKEEAGFLLGELAARDPHNPERMLMLARYYRGVGEKDSAYAVLRRLTDVNPRLDHGVLGSWLYEDGRLTEAARVVKKMAEASDKPVWPEYEWLGRTYMQLGRYDEAIEAYKEALVDTSCKYVVMPKLAMAYVHNGQADEARRFVRVNRVDNPAFGHGTLMGVYRALGMHDDAIYHAQRFLEFARDTTSRRGAMSITLYLAGRDEEARPYFDTAIRANPNRATNYLRYARSLSRSGHTAEAYNVLESYVDYTSKVATEDTSGFSDALVDFYLGRLSEDDVLRPSFGNERDSLWKNEAAWHVVGMAYLLNFGRSLKHPAPDTTRAIEYLRKSLRYGSPENATRIMTLAELQRLGVEV